MRRPVAWAAVAMVNLSAMTLFIWHETALVTVSSLGLLVGRVPGLLTGSFGERPLGGRTACLATGVRDRARRFVAGVPPGGEWLTGAQGQRRGLDLAEPQVGHETLAAADGEVSQYLL